MINQTALSTPWAKERSWMADIFLVLGASILIGLFAHVSFRLPFTPVPIATQAQVILFLAALLGSKRGSLAVLAFLAEGAAGLPVFAGGRAGLLPLGPSSGYLIGYLLAAYVTGLLIERMRERTVGSTFLAMLAGNAVIFLCGYAWLSHLIGAKGALLFGVLPFLLGDLLKLVLATKGLKALKFFN